MSNKWIEIEEILTGLLGDLTISVMVLKEYESKVGVHDPQHLIERQCMWRLCIFSIVINCCKYVELNKKYGGDFNRLIPEYNRIRGAFNEKIKDNRSISKLRNHCVAHVSDKSVYLKPSEVQEEIITMFGDKYGQIFLDWICPDNLHSTDQTTSLVGVIQLLRNAVSARAKENQFERCW